MAYAEGNPKTKKELKTWVADGKRVEVFSPGMEGNYGFPPASGNANCHYPFDCKQDGEETIEGPHYPKPHSWYARVQVEDGVITKVLS